MAENSTPSSSSPKPLQQTTPLIESTNSQQLQHSLASSSPSLDQQHQMVQSQQQLVQQQLQPQTVQSQQQQLQQLQQHIQNNSNNVNISNNSNNFIGVSNFQGLQRNTSVSRLNQLQHNSNIGNQLRQQNSGIYGQMNFGGMNVMQQPNNNSQIIMNSNSSNNQQQQIQLQQQNQLQHQQIGQQNQLQQQQIGQQNQLQQQQTGQQNQLQQQQIGQQNQLQQQIGQQNQLQQQQIGQPNQLQQQQMGQMGVGNLSRSALMGQTGHLPMLSGQAGAASGQFNLQNQFLSSPRQKAGFMQASQFQLGNSPGQSLQGMQAMGMTGSLNLISQLRPNGTLGYNQQRTSAQLRQHLTPHNALTANQILQGQNIARTSLLNGQISGLAQNGQTAAIMQNLSRQQWLKQQMPSMSSPNSPALRLQQQRQLLLQQQFVASQLNQNSLGPNTQQLSPTVQQQAQTQVHQSKQQQPSQQLLNQQQSPRMEAPGGQKPASLIGSQPDAATVSGAATPGGSSSQGTEASNQLLGKRKIQDLADQMGGNVKLDPEVQDFLLEFADNFLDSVTKFACTLAKHRKSSTLEAKDVLLHLEKNWNLKVPGFSTEDKKHKPDHPPSDAHKKRMDAIRTSVEPVQSEPNNTSKQMMVRQGPSNPVGPSQMIRPSPSSEQLIAQSAMPQMLQQNTRF